MYLILYIAIIILSDCCTKSCICEGGFLEKKHFHMMSLPLQWQFVAENSHNRPAMDEKRAPF